MLFTPVSYHYTAELHTKVQNDVFWQQHAI